MTNDQAKTSILSVCLPPGVKESLEDAAERDHRTLSGFVRKILLETLENRSEEATAT